MIELYNSSIHRRMSTLHLRASLLLFLLLSLTNGQVQYLQFQVDPVLVTRANFYLNMLNTYVQTYNWAFCNKIQLYNSVTNTLTWLRLIRNSIPCGNVVDGSDNAVSGINNVVVGNKNKVNGVNNWVFVSNYKTNSTSTTYTDSILAIGNYQIDLTKISSIPTNPSNAISMINSDGYNSLCTKNTATSFFFSS
jgi:hypothetical protein